MFMFLPWHHINIICSYFWCKSKDEKLDFSMSPPLTGGTDLRTCPHFLHTFTLHRGRVELTNKEQIHGLLWLSKPIRWDRRWWLIPSHWVHSGPHIVQGADAEIC